MIKLLLDAWFEVIVLHMEYILVNYNQFAYNISLLATNRHKAVIRKEARLLSSERVMCNLWFLCKIKSGTSRWKKCNNWKWANMMLRRPYWPQITSKNKLKIKWAWALKPSTQCALLRPWSNPKLKTMYLPRQMMA